MDAREIRDKAADIKRRLREHDAARKLIEGEQLALRHACPHEHVKEWSGRDYSGGSDYYWLCEDCGAEKHR